MPAEGSLTLYQGEHYEITLSVVTAAGAAVNITGWTFDFTIRTKYGGDLVFSASSGDGIEIASAAGGTATLTIQAETTIDLVPGRRVFAWRRTNANAEAVLVIGPLDVRPSVWDS